MFDSFLIAIAAAVGTAFAAWLLDRWLGIRAGFASLRGKVGAVLDDFPAVRDTQAELRDSVGRLTGQMRVLDGRMTDQDKVLATLLAMTLGEFEAATVPKFVCDSEGRNVNANAAYCTLLDVDREDLLGLRWRSLIPADLLLPWIAQFELAQRDHRKLEGEIAMRHSSGRLIRLRVHMLPFPPDIGPATHWVGILTEIPA